MLSVFTRDAYNLFHTYYLYADGVKGCKGKRFISRKDAEIYMQRIADKYNLEDVECVERDLHERVYKSKTNKSITFYINRLDKLEN